MKDCLICGSPVETFICFGQMPIANAFVAHEQFAHEHFFEIKGLNAGFSDISKVISPLRAFCESLKY